MLIDLSRPVHKHKKIRLLTPLQTRHPATTRNDEVLYDPDQPLQLSKGNKLHLTTLQNMSVKSNSIKRSKLSSVAYLRLKKDFISRPIFNRRTFSLRSPAV